MQSAFSLRRALPTPCPGIFTGHDRRGAVRTANAGIVAIVQFVVRHLVDLDISPYVFPRPFGQGIHFDQLEFAIPLDQLGISSRWSLITPDSGNPGVKSLEHTGQRLDLPQLATLVRIAGP